MCAFYNTASIEFEAIYGMKTCLRTEITEIARRFGSLIARQGLVCHVETCAECCKAPLTLTAMIIMPLPLSLNTTTAGCSIVVSIYGRMIFV